MPETIPVFSLIDEADRENLKRTISEAYERAGTAERHAKSAVAIEETGEEDGGLEEGAPLKLAEFYDLIGIDPSVYRQIEAAVNSGKQHIMFYGPPGTGKTTLARRLAGVLNGKSWEMITGSADWSSQDIIGGYQPLAAGDIRFFPGVLLRNFDRPLIIDELNRCDIDKVIGPLFSVLSGQSTTLPYRLRASEADSPQYVILPTPKPGALEHEYAPASSWRLIATINSMDKASLYQMSYALSRRFGWIFVDAPSDTKRFVQEFSERFLKREPRTFEGTPPLAAIWNAVNDVRRVGPAPIIDALRVIDQLSPGSDLLVAPKGDLVTFYLDAFDLFVLPMLDGILGYQAEQIGEAVIQALALDPEAAEAKALRQRVKSVAI